MVVTSQPQSGYRLPFTVEVKLQQRMRVRRVNHQLVVMLGGHEVAVGDVVVEDAATMTP